MVLLGDRVEMESEALGVEKTGHALADLDEQRSTLELIEV